MRCAHCCTTNCSATVCGLTPALEQIIMKSIFHFESENGTKEVVVDLRLWGMEYYFVDGKQVFRKFSLGFKGVREFTVDNDVIRIVAIVSTKKFHCRAEVNDTIIVNELFPKMTEKFEINANPASRKKASIIRTLILCILVSVVIFSVFNKSKLKSSSD